MNTTKPARARIIVDKIYALDEEIGAFVPARPDGRKSARLVEDAPRWSATITKGQRITIAPVYADGKKAGRVVLGERSVVDSECVTVELQDQQRRSVLVVNLRGEELEIHRFIPGHWENWLGVDNGEDEVAYDRLAFPRPGRAELRELLARADAQLQPLRRGPTDLDIGRSFFADKSRRRAWPGENAKFPPLS